ncbi:MAG: ribosome biogenesis GTP-binding protein YihA/YsxC [Alphaproteobacteria bacterium]|nr:ribosome biogenesis GTP-binding protein YihA/YsxC [Alphaproteobacteria bacterium]
MLEQDASSELTPARLEEGRRFFAKPCDFILSASQPENFDLIGVDYAEVAFWGRSNVGKSSLLNAITGRKALARASNTPGRTQQIVFFNMADALLFADLPGYGHAKAPPEEVKKWNAFIRYYLKKRAKLRCVLLLIDARHGVMKIDMEMMDFLDRMAVNYQVVLTKADQVRGGDPTERVAETEAFLKKHPAARPHVLLTSSEKGQGIPHLRTFLLGLAEIG